jgi:hypothetical protein
MVVKTLERQPTAQTALAAAHLNMGVAEVVYAEMIAREHNHIVGVDVPLDAALRSWKQGLSVLEKQQKRQQQHPSSAVLQARLNANMAWGLLQITGEKDHVQRASDFARRSLAIYDDDQSNNEKNQEGLSRTLTLAAECYHKSGAAVTVEGLLQSASDKKKSQHSHFPSQIIEVRDALQAYANLCQNWDKTSG